MLVDRGATFIAFNTHTTSFMMNFFNEPSVSNFSESDDDFVDGTPPPSETNNVNEHNGGIPDAALDFNASPTFLPTVNPISAPLNVSTGSPSHVDQRPRLPTTSTSAQDEIENSDAHTSDLDAVNVSEEVRNLMGVHVPANTLRNNATAMRMLVKFMIKEKYATEELSAPDAFYFFFGEPTSEITVEQRKKFRDVLREFVVRHRQEDGSQVTPSTMIGYIRSLNRSLAFNDYQLNMFEDPLFTDKRDGLMPVLDNHFAEQQAAGMTVKHHNTLPRKDLIHILDQAICDERTSLGYVYRYIIAFGIALGVRPTAMWELTIDQFSKTTLDGKHIYLYTERIGSRSGGSKTKRGGVKYISREPVQIPLFDIDLLDGRLNFFKMYEHLLSIRPDCDSKRLFLQINRGRTKPEEFFKRQNLGKGFFDRAVKTVCSEAGVTGSGLNDYMTNHGLRSSMTSLLVEAGHSDSSIILRTGHSNTTTLARYHNLRGAEGLRQQESLFRSLNNGDNDNLSSPEIKKRAKVAGSNTTEKLEANLKTSASYEGGNSAEPPSALSEIGDGPTKVITIPEKSSTICDAPNNNIALPDPSSSTGNSVNRGSDLPIPTFLHNISSSGSSTINITVNWPGNNNNNNNKNDNK